MKTKRYEIPAWLARKREHFATFIGVETRRTGKAVYIIGRGTAKAHVSCMCCGRALTNAISRALGIGPICIENYPVFAGIDYNNVRGMTDKIESVKLLYIGGNASSAPRFAGASDPSILMGVPSLFT